jgi:hypothetical protein
MDTARLVFAVPGDPDVLRKLCAAVGAQGDPPIAVDRTAAAVLAFQCATWDMMLRSRMMLAFEDALGPGWHRLVTPVE